MFSFLTKITAAMAAVLCLNASHLVGLEFPTTGETLYDTTMSIERPEFNTTVSLKLKLHCDGFDAEGRQLIAVKVSQASAEVQEFGELYEDHWLLPAWITQNHVGWGELRSYSVDSEHQADSDDADYVQRAWKAVHAWTRMEILLALDENGKWAFVNGKEVNVFNSEWGVEIRQYLKTVPLLPVVNSKFILAAIGREFVDGEGYTLVNLGLSSNSSMMLTAEYTTDDQLTLSAARDIFIPGRTVEAEYALAWSLVDPTDFTGTWRTFHSVRDGKSSTATMQIRRAHGS